jgi:hypothetical protein
MIAILNGETLPVVRQREGVVWCPFCDRSRQISRGWICSCGASFEDDPAVETPAPVMDEAEETEEPPQPRRRRNRQ